MADNKMYKSKHSGPTIDKAVDKVVAAGDHPLIPDGGYDVQGAYRLQGSLDLMGESALTGLPAPVDGSDAANKEYVDKVSGPSAESIPVAQAQSSDGKSYTATVEGITQLKAGMMLTFWPKAYNAAGEVTLNINGLGAKAIYRGVSSTASQTVTEFEPKFFAPDAPVLIQYDEWGWMLQGWQKPASDDLQGTLKVKKGGTGKISWIPSCLVYATGSTMLGQVPAPEEDASLLVSDKTGGPYWAGVGDVLEAAGGATKDYVDDRAGPRENLLVNWYFLNPINQRGLLEYTANGWTMDRWRKRGAGTTIQLMNTVPRLIAPESGKLMLDQPVDPNRMLYDKPYTLSLLYNQFGVSGTKLLTVTGMWDTDFESENGLIASEEGVVSVYMKSSDYRVVIEVQPGVTVIPHAIMLEQGEGQTLAWKPDEQTSWTVAVPPPDMATELLKCMRYYQKSWVGKPISEMNVNHTSNLIRTAIGQWVLGSVEFPVQMNSDTPSIKLYTYKGTEYAANPVTDDGEPEITEIPCQAYKPTAKGFIVISSDGDKPFTKGDGYTFFYEAQCV